MSFEIAPVGANAVNTRPDIALLQANATSALAKISGDVKSSNVAQVAPTNPPAGLVSSLAATQTAITSTQNAVNVLQTADAAYAKGVTLAQQGVALATDRLTTSGDSAAIDTQLLAVQAGIDSIGANTTFGGIPVLGNPVTAAVNSTGASITVIPEAIASVNSGGSVQPGSIAEFQAAAAAITSSRSTNAGNLISLQNSLQVLESTITNQQAAIGQALDVSVVKEMMNLTSTNIMTDPAAALQAQAMQMSNAVFKLL
jgi:flagellin-like hook-associated protein FlgL